MKISTINGWKFGGKAIIYGYSVSGNTAIIHFIKRY